MVFDERMLSIAETKEPRTRTDRSNASQQADVTVARGGTVEQACRELGISEASSWRIHDR